MSPSQLTAGVGSSSAFLTVERQLGGVPQTTGALSVTVATSSSRGQFAASPGEEINWAPTASLTIPDGQSSVSFSYRDGSVGSSTLTASTTGYPNAAATVVVAPLHTNDDFEGGGLLFSDAVPGQWKDMTSGAPSLFGLDAGAARRGNFGLGHHDLQSVATNGEGGRLGTYFGLIGPALYVRFWFRMSGEPSGGAVVPAIVGVRPSYASFFNFYVEPTGRVAFGGYNVDLSQFDYDGTPAHVADGGWFLVEMVTDGMGSAQAARRLFINGADAGVQLANMDGGSFWRFDVGQPWGQPRTWTGNADFDDVRVSPSILPSRVGVQPEAELVAGTCTRVGIELQNSVTGVATAPLINVQLDLSSAGPANAQWFSSEECGASIGSITIDGSEGARSAWIRPESPGSVTLQAINSDYLGGTFTTEVSGAPDPDGSGRDLGRASLAVGCGCAQTDPAVLVGLLLCIAGMRRRIRRRH